MAFDSIIRETALGGVMITSAISCLDSTRLRQSGGFSWPPSKLLVALVSWQIWTSSSLTSLRVCMLARGSRPVVRDRFVQTFAGVRLGNPMTDVLFVVVLGHVLKGVQDELEWAACYPD